MMLFLIIAGWVACAALGHAMIFGYFQNAYPDAADNEYWSDLRASLIPSIFGPVSLLAAVVFTRWLSSRGPQKWKWI